MHKSHACTSTSRLQCCRRFLILFHKIWLKFVLVTTNRWTSECYGMEASKDRTLKKDKTLIKIWIPSIDSKSFCHLTWFIDAPPHENWRTMCYFWTNPHFMTATLTVSFSMKQTTLFKKINSRIFIGNSDNKTLKIICHFEKSKEWQQWNESYIYTKYFGASATYRCINYILMVIKLVLLLFLKI